VIGIVLFVGGSGVLSFAKDLVGRRVVPPTPIAAE